MLPAALGVLRGQAWHETRHPAKRASTWSWEASRRERGVSFTAPDYSTMLQLEKTVTNLSRKKGNHERIDRWWNRFHRCRGGQAVADSVHEPCLSIDDNCARTEWDWELEYQVEEMIEDFVKELADNPQRYAQQSINLSLSRFRDSSTLNRGFKKVFPPVHEKGLDVGQVSIFDSMSF